MTTTALALGRNFDITPAFMPADAVAGAITGLRVHAKYGGTYTLVIIKDTDAGTTDDFQLDLQEHNASTAGTSQDLDIITDYFYKQETTLDGDESWSKTTQTAASEIAAIAGTAETEMLIVVEVTPEQLSDGFEWISVNIPDLGSTDVQTMTGVWIVSDLHAPRVPTNLPDHLT